MSILFVENPLVVNTVLAQRIGLNESIVLQQLNYWLKKDASGIEHEGRRWVYNTYAEWVMQFPFWSESQVKRIFTSLRNLGVIEVKQIRASQHDRTNYYTVNFDHELLKGSKDAEQTKASVRTGETVPSMGANSPDRTGQNRPFDEDETVPSMSTNSSDLSETTTKTTTEITAEITKQRISDPPKKPKRLTPAQKRDQEVMAAKPSHVDDETWEMFIEHRKEIKAPMTSRAAQMLANRLLNHSSVDAVRAIEQSVENGWKGVFPERQQAQPQGRVIDAHAERAQRLAKELGYT